MTQCCGWNKMCPQRLPLHRMHTTQYVAGNSTTLWQNVSRIWLIFVCICMWELQSIILLTAQYIVFSLLKIKTHSRQKVKNSTIFARHVSHLQILKYLLLEMTAGQRDSYLHENSENVSWVTFNSCTVSPTWSLKVWWTLMLQVRPHHCEKKVNSFLPHKIPLCLSLVESRCTFSSHVNSSQFL